MALNPEEIAQAAELLNINERRLRVRDRQIEIFGGNTPPEIKMEAEDLRRKIMALKAVLEPELPDEISGLVKRRLEDDYFIFQQTLGAKQDVAILREDVAKIKVEQSAAALWRLGVQDRLLVDDQRAEAGRRRNWRMQLINFALMLIVLGGMVWLAMQIHGR